MPDPIHIVCAADAKYGSYTGIMLSSVLKSNPGETLHVHLLSDRVRSRDIDRMSRMLAHNGSRISVCDVAAKLDENAHTMKTISYVSRTTYARLFADRYLPADVRHFIYLDGDIVCRASLRELWTAVQNCELIAAVPNKSEKSVLEEVKTRLGMPSDANYFNMGLLGLNLENWRKLAASEQLIKYLGDNIKIIRWGEQDVINAVLWKNIAALPERWNIQIGAYSTEEAEKLIQNAAIVHYTGTRKPWQIGYSGAAGSLFRGAKAVSPWRWMLPESRFATRLKKSLRKKYARILPPNDSLLSSADIRKKA